MEHRISGTTYNMHLSGWVKQVQGEGQTDVAAVGAEERCPMKRLVLLTLLGAGLTRKVVADIVTMKDGGAK